MRYDHHVRHEPTKRERTWIYRPLPDARQQHPLFIASAGHSVWLAGERFSRTASSIFGVEYVCAGNVEFIQNGASFLIQPGEAYLLRKGGAHEYATGPAGKVVKRYIVIAGAGLEYYLRFLRLWDQDHIRPQSSHVFEHLLKDTTTLLRHASPELPASVAARLSGLAYQILLELSHCVQTRLSPAIEETLTFMHENLHRFLSREEICAHVGISAPYFNRVFSRTMGKSLVAYFLEQKFNWTAELLNMTTLSIKEIAYQAGFDNPLYFSAQFKKRFGVSPQRYRQAEKERL